MPFKKTRFLTSFLTFKSNKDTYEAEDVVRGRCAQSELQKPEEAILRDFKDKLNGMKMLDIGVGGGRTTCSFAELAGEYVGIDYSKNMIEACERRFPDAPQNISFKICDARSMDIFEDDYFDFVLFSYNGIDNVSHEDRLRILQEIRRVGKKGGFFCFSTHNLLGIDKLLAFNPSASPIKVLWKIILLKSLNKSFKELKDKAYAIINDGTYQFRLLNYYIKPKEQIKQLENLGFKNIRVYSITDGQEVERSTLDTTADLWLYYLCNIYR